MEFSLETFGMKFKIFQIVQRSRTVMECLAHMSFFFKAQEKNQHCNRRMGQRCEDRVCKSRNTNAKTQKRKSKQIKVIYNQGDAI